MKPEGKHLLTVVDELAKMVDSDTMLITLLHQSVELLMNAIF